MPCRRPRRRIHSFLKPLPAIGAKFDFPLISRGLLTICHPLEPHTMPTTSQTKMMRLYANIMQEIKIRIWAINAGVGGHLPVLPPPIVQEHCFLQLRMICELIALSCLVAHGDVKGTDAPKLQKEWSAEKIMNELEKLHPEFYPLAVKRENLTIRAIDPQPCEKLELLRIYGKCGDALHRGRLKTLLSQTTPKTVDYKEILSIGRKIIDLLTHHIITSADQRTYFICILKNDEDGRVTIAIAERPA
jgi:hypothetical protein